MFTLIFGKFCHTKEKFTKFWRIFLCALGDTFVIGLSKERPIFGDHPKAHIYEIRQISREIRQISCEIKRHSLPTALHKTEEFLLSYLIYKVFRWISWNPPDFTWNLPDFERPIARNVTPMFYWVTLPADLKNWDLVQRQIGEKLSN